MSYNTCASIVDVKNDSLLALMRSFFFPHQSSSWRTWQTFLSSCVDLQMIFWKALQKALSTFSTSSLYSWVASIGALLHRPSRLLPPWRVDAQSEFLLLLTHSVRFLQQNEEPSLESQVCRGLRGCDAPYGANSSWCCSASHVPERETLLHLQTRASIG